MSPLSISPSFVARKTNKNHKRPQIYICIYIYIYEEIEPAAKQIEWWWLSFTQPNSTVTNLSLVALGLFGLVLSFGSFGDYVMKVWGFHLGLENIDLWVSMCALLKLFLFFGMGLQFDLPFFSMFIWIENLEFLGNFLNFQNIVF